MNGSGSKTTGESISEFSSLLVRDLGLGSTFRKRVIYGTEVGVTTKRAYLF
jgi:hypothetical protein